jgi:enoyl-CoA hydratase/carnithine racemase
MAYETILYEVADQIATVTLNRPTKLNAYTATMGREIVEAVRRADDDGEVRVIILTGAGRAFCAGADISGLPTISRRARAAAQRTRSGAAGCSNFRR